MANCSVSGCSKKTVARGWCAMHYRRWKKHGDPEKVIQPQFRGLALPERLMARCEKSPSGCWEWTGSADQKGYGRLNIGDKPMLTHRVSWEVHKGPIPDGKHVLHKCDNPRCLRPAHLFLGDQSANMADMDKKRRRRSGISLGEAHGMSKLTADAIREIRASTAPSNEIALKFGVSGRTVRDVRNFKIWKHVT